MKKAYTIEERRKLLAYLATLEPDAYVLAIMLAFYGIFRIGEIKGLCWDYNDGNIVTIKNQLVEERVLKSDLTLGQPRKLLKAVSYTHLSAKVKIFSLNSMHISLSFKPPFRSND